MFHRPLIALALATLLAAAPLFAYESPLSDRTVREAYFLGQHHDDSTQSALKPYLHTLRPPQKGPYIEDIQLLTPYAQVIDSSNAKSAGYSAQQAAEDYRVRKDLIVVRFHIEFTPTYGLIESLRDSKSESEAKGITIRDEDFWQAFHTGLSQNDQWIEPLSRDGEPIYSQGPQNDAIVGAYIWVTYDAHDVASEPADAEIFTPDGQHIVSTFDLATLR
jgi:hypothetical protein